MSGRPVFDHERPLSRTLADVEGWLLALVSALDRHELLSIGVAACAAGHSQAMVRCTRCFDGTLPPMKFTQAVRHIREAEDSHRAGDGLVDGPNAAAHGPGDLVPAEPPRPTRPARSPSKPNRWRRR